MERSWVQPKKALSQITFRLSGSEIEDKLVQYAKFKLPSSAMLLGSVTSVRPAQPKNAASPIAVRLSGKDTFVTLVQ